jgi:hypothetical protein
VSHLVQEDNAKQHAELNDGKTKIPLRCCSHQFEADEQEKEQVQADADAGHVAKRERPVDGIVPG